MDGECAGKVALVTGASRGIGAGIARRLAAEGASVAAVARSLDSHTSKFPGTLRETVARITADGGRAVAIQGDVLDAGSRAAFVAACQEQLGPIDILVNNAALGPYRPFDRFTDHDFEVTLGSNFRAPFDLCQLVVPAMRERGSGWILNISSASAEHPVGPPFPAWEQTTGHLLYASSKAALNRFTTGLAAELQGTGIAVNALSPVAAVITPAVQALGMDKWLDPSMVEPVEWMAEAALALCCCDPATTTGCIAYSGPLLEKLGRRVRTLDGRAPHEGK
jgi:NAD(P)-dependent dehydrogenase (short-subunit alcohol dehydrogenase family)